MRERNRSHTRKGPGLMAHSKRSPHPPGSKLVRRFIRDAQGENHAYRKIYLALTGRTHT